MGGDEDDEAKQKQAEENIEIWKIKKLIKSLQLARGCAPAINTPLRRHMAAIRLAQDAASSAPDQPLRPPAVQCRPQARGCGAAATRMGAPCRALALAACQHRGSLCIRASGGPSRCPQLLLALPLTLPPSRAVQPLSCLLSFSLLAATAPR
jgi:hypothetical protein